MTTSNDKSTPVSLDESLHAIGRIDWPGTDRNQRIEEHLMNSTVIASKAPAAGRIRRRPGLWLGAGALLASGLVYGSVRLYDRYKVRVNVNGVEHIHEVQSGPDGTAMVEVTLPDGKKARMLVGPENKGPDGEIRAGISVSENPPSVRKNDATAAPQKKD